ncbi:hypothetical protein KAR91_16995 [Candidatus Pacearchaeota archaeon]|nr:hypothetical protein [Candidatus Pacearchaeota archaeon]
MPSLDMKAVFEALLPPGSLWQPAPAAGFDQFLNALGENADDIYERLYDLGSIRDPRKTPILSDLEKEYGVYTNLNLTEAVRRQQLAAIKYAKPGTASDSLLQAILRNAGFDVYVRRNHAPVDPADLLQDQYLLEAGEIDAFAGEPNAIAGRGGGELLVNGPIVVTSVDYDAQANGAAMFAGEPSAIAGFFNETTQTPITYEIPANPDYWPYIFFIAGQQWGHLNDWNFNYATMGAWVVSQFSDATKNQNASFINSGIRSLSLRWGAAAGVALGGDDCNVVQVLDTPISNLVDVSGYFWGDGANAFPVIQYRTTASSTWNLGDFGTTSTVKQPFSFTTSSANLSEIRLLTTRAGTVQPDDQCYFDDILFEVNDIARAQVPSEREAEFKRLILKYKPLDTWAGLIVDYT